ncbi:MAG: outer membrane protein OmpA-like peptidoglycan-associated protein [Yoonia sp.]
MTRRNAILHPADNEGKQMATSVKDTLRALTGGAIAGAMTLSLLAGAAQAQTNTGVGESFEATVWIDPDGCEHWVMDDGFEGYMSPHRTRDGRPVCHRSEICGIIPTDQLFATDKSIIPNSKKTELMNFFQSANAFGFLIYGHTDARASDEYNMGLSQRRASAVSSIAQSAGANVVDVKGFGERQPRAQGGSAAAMQQNRRVEIYCVR